MKWLLAAVAAVLVGIAVFSQFNSTKTTYINGLAPYTSMPGRNFVVEQDCYVFKLTSEDTSWALIGSHETVPELPEQVKESNVGAKFPGVRILDVIHLGDHFKIASVRRDQSRKRTRISYEIVLENESTRKYPRLDAYFILDHSSEKLGEAPKIMTDYAVQLGPDK